MRDLLSISNLRTQFATDRGRVKAVDGVVSYLRGLVDVLERLAADLHDR